MVIDKRQMRSVIESARGKIWHYSAKVEFMLCRMLSCSIALVWLLLLLWLGAEPSVRLKTADMRSYFISCACVFGDVLFMPKVA